MAAECQLELVHSDMNASASQFASFAAYTSPPDQVEVDAPPRSTGTRSSYPDSSYQSGDIPTFSSPNLFSSPQEGTNSNQWETRYGWRVDLLACSAYVLGPLSALTLLILETHNDYVRFHAYQSALLTTPLVFFRIIFSMLGFPSWIKTFSTFTIIAIQFLVGFLAYRHASLHSLDRFHVPFIGSTAENWLAEE
ncbi:hypothetical protein BJ912DRAFT_204939 [Pholiota molesta]|nr:hypothetical protein BJ912DRAFT_204939 [Pholiota molesta]